MSKHLTAHSTEDEKILGRYAFLDVCGTTNVNQNNRAKLENEITFKDNQVGLFSARFNQNGTKIIAGYGSGAVEVNILIWTCCFSCTICSIHES